MDKLPGHVLIKICQYLEPFDVLNFGRTCHHLHKLTSSWFLWTFLALSWCQGVWNYLPQKADEGPEDPKQWLLHLLRLCRDRGPPKAEVVSFENGEKWRRLQNDKFACKVSMLACTYEAMNNRKSPFVLQCIWVYDIALFERLNPRIHLDVLDLNLDSNSASELATLGKARPYDLRGHKHPQIDARNYISSKLPSVTWCKDLFSHGPKGSICPLLVCPSAHGYDLESSGVDGLITCVSYCARAASWTCLPQRTSHSWSHGYQDQGNLLVLERRLHSGIRGRLRRSGQIAPWPMPSSACPTRDGPIWLPGR
ncbi:hypothetical protein HPB51_021182 [Rhipicephalus microplus]|uniref:F-box domain-containing protein n=1 Tax=Rhipicephalus microplus TaxID=6941 RepID=A0A9J6F5M7_RHIMP|nr:hypothetical protein HPB51_021182 [Rhipicephalus microplus]